MSSLSKVYIMQIVLAGYMGSGKSRIGKVLAKKLKYRFTDLDQFIAQQEAMPVTALFRTKGELYFRKKERFYLEALLNTNENTVIALGGGTPCYGDNMELILRHTPHVFYLKATVETLIQRLKRGQQSRPLIKDIKAADLPDFIRKHLFERSYFYLKAPYTIAVDGLQPKAVAAAILEKIREMEK